MNDYPESAKWRSPISISGSWTEPWSIQRSYMSKFILGIVLTIFLISYNGEVKRFIVDSGIRDQIVTYLGSW